jgi:hypothetical protein
MSQRLSLWKAGAASAQKASFFFFFFGGGGGVVGEVTRDFAVAPKDISCGHPAQRAPLQQGLASVSMTQMYSITEGSGFNHFQTRIENELALS